MQLRLQQRAAPPPAFAVTLPLLAIATTFVLTAGIVVAAGENPFRAYEEFFVTPLSSEFRLLEVLVSATPILFTGAAVAVAFRAGYWNIGAEGQLLCGAIAAAWLGTVVDDWPRLISLPLLVAGGLVAGAAWALPPALLRIRFGIDEVVTTLLLNPVALLLVSGVLNGPWRDPVTRFPESPRIAAAAEFPQLVDRSRLHLGFLLALVVLAIVWFVAARTPTGLRVRAVGLSPRAARFAGIRVERTLLGAALASGAIAGLAGVSEVAGIQFRLTEGISSGFGYTGIVVATLGGLAMVGVALAAFFLGLVNVGAGSASRVLDVPSQLGEVITAVLLLVTVALLIFRRYQIARTGPA
jgi:general nucleoside transport system permease protein